MNYEWVKAHAALQFVSVGGHRRQAIETICRRAHTGTLVAKAALFQTGESRYTEAFVPKEFWWAEGHEALEQDWIAGDFETWIGRNLQLRAFDVSFDFLALTELIPAPKRGEAMQSFSVAADPDWISSHDLYHLAFTRFNPSTAGLAIIDVCQTGHIVARAARMQMFVAGKPDQLDSASIEWDVPLWFWRNFTGAGSSHQDWLTGRLSGRGAVSGISGASGSITLQGVHFHRSGLPSLGLRDNTPQASEASRKTRRPEYDWASATSAIWGQLYRGELIPKVQADVEKALIVHLTIGDKEPGESTVRPYAKAIWDEFQKQ